ncbi:MAG: hypothetical protein JF924_18950 [Candidatus Dormibacteraeota bacterium]|nr:hypothetical protein [Candidatus Dormibacteraeota bacterium]
MANVVTSGAASVLQLRSVGGAVNDLAPDATAYAHRQQNFSLVVSTSEQRQPQLDAAWDAGIALHTSGAYLNLGTARDDATLRRAYPP